MKRIVRIGLFFTSGLAALGLGAVPAAWAAQNSYLELNCQTQGLILGDSPVSSLNRLNKIEVNEVHHLIHEDPATGRLTHEPLIFTKQVERSTVNLYSALANAEPCTAVFRFYRPDPSGSGIVQQYRTITLGNARLVAMEPISTDTLNPAVNTYPDRERVRMVYSTITIDYIINGATITLATN